MKKHYQATIDLEQSAGELAESWVNGNRNYVVDVLAGDHPGLAVLMIVQFAQEGLLSAVDCNSIANRLIDRRGEIALDDSIPFVE